MKLWKINPIRKFLNQRQLKFSVKVLAAAAVFIYMLIATSEALWQNYRTNQEIGQLKIEIVQLEKANLQIKNLIAYLKTESFREKEARRKLGYKKPGEQVVALPQDNFVRTDLGTTKDAGTPEPEAHLSNPQKWWDYIFG